MDRSCRTKYPIMLVHGIGYNDTNFNKYWGRIPDFLRERGAEIYFGNQDAFGSITDNAIQLKKTALDVLERTGAQKLNLIAHSKGGIEARYMISQLEMAEVTASLTTLATPHRGIISMDRVRARAGAVYKGLISIFNAMLWFDSGERNRSLKPYEQLTAEYMQIFNELVPDAEGVLYQSYAFDMKNSRSDPAIGLFHVLVRKIEGPNDGLVSVKSAQWGDFRGVYTGPGSIGISHPNVVDAAQRALTEKKSGGGILDITDLYWDIAARLKALGY